MGLGTYNYLTAAQLAQLTTAELESATILNSRSQINAADSPPYIFLSEDVSLIDIYASNFTPTVIAKMRSSIFLQLTNYQLSCFNDEKTFSISANCIKALSADQVRSMAHTCSLSTQSVAALNAAQVAAISVDFKWMSVEWMASLSSSALAGLTFGQLSQLNMNVLSEALNVNSVIGKKFASALPSGVRDGLYLNFIAKNDPQGLSRIIPDLTVTNEYIGVLNDETLCKIISLKDTYYGDGNVFICHLFEQGGRGVGFTSGIVEALNHSPGFIQKLWQSSFSDASISIIQNIFKVHPGVVSGLNGMVWTTLAQQSPNGFVALGSFVTSDALVKMCEYSPTALNPFSKTQVSQLLATRSDFFTKLEASPYLTKQQKLGLELFCYGQDSNSTFSRYFNGGPLTYLLNDGLNYTNQFDLGNVSVTLGARNFASWYSDAILLTSSSNQAALIRDMYKQTAEITWLNGNTPAREALVRDIQTLFGSLGIVNSGIIDLGAPPVGASDTDVQAYCIKVLGKMGQMTSAIKSMQEFFDNVSKDFGDLRYATIDSFGLQLDESAAAFLLNGSPSINQAGGLTYRNNQRMTFADAAYLAITETLTQINASFRNCSNGIEGVMQNKKVEDLRNYYREIFAGISGALTLLTSLASGASAFLNAQGVNGWTKALYASGMSAVSTGINGIVSMVNNFESISGWGQSTKAINFYHLTQNVIAQGINPYDPIYSGLTKDKLDNIVSLQRDTAANAIKLVNKSLVNIDRSATSTQDVTTQKYFRKGMEKYTLANNPSLFNISLSYDAGGGKVGQVQHQLTAQELGVDANHSFAYKDEKYNILLPELNNVDTGCFARGVEVSFKIRNEIGGQIPNGTGGYTPTYVSFTDMKASVINYYL